MLVVDDDEPVRRGLVEALSGGGISAVGAGCAAEALRAVELHDPVAVVLDNRLPDSSGIELAGHLKERDPDLPVLLLTGFASLSSAMEAVGRLDAYLLKPISPADLLQSVRNAMDRRELVLEHRSAVERLRKMNKLQALRDPLTNLPNRALLEDRMAQAFAASERDGTTLAVMFVDLDGFKGVNDMFGHRVGDIVLRRLAHRLWRLFRRSDTVARFGGDEFVLVCPEAGTPATACKIAQQVIDQLAIPVLVDGVEHRLSASVGIALHAGGASGATAESVLRDADIAMYRAKKSGPGTCEVFDQDMRAQVARRFETERGLRAAFPAGELVLAYQPVVEVGTRRLAGAEALLRWNRPGRGTVLPDEFLDVAEQANLSLALGEWVIEQAISDMALWRDSGRDLSGFRLWVNVSPLQLADARFAGMVQRRLEQQDVDPRGLGIEIVESALVDRGVTVTTLEALKGAGIGLSLDDFGAGHSNLTWLQELPITALKIDRRFVAALEGGPGHRDAAIARGLVQLGHCLGLTVVGEGVETPAQASTLRALECDLAQGYYFGRPAPEAQLGLPYR